MSPGKSLKKRTMRALLWDMGGTFLKRGNTFIISIFLARLLEPAEFGLVGMAMVFVSITQVLIDVGFNSAIVQKQDTPPGAYHTIFFINLGIGFSLAGVFYLAAPYIAGFYGQPEVEGLVKWLSLLCIIKSFNQVQMSLLKKDLNFKLLTVRLVAGSVIGGIVGVTMAFMGFGVYSIVAQNLVSATVSTITMWTVAGWRPKWYFRFADVKGMISYSTYILADRLLSEITKKVDVLVVGKVFDAATLGFYTRATSLRDQVTHYSSASLLKVFFPVLSGLQHDNEAFERVYFRAFSVLTFASFLITGLLIILGQDIVVLLFGEKWLPSVPLFQVLILAASNYPMSSLMVNAFVSKGLSRQNFLIGIVRKIFRLIPLSVAVFVGLMPFVITYVVVSYWLSALNVGFLGRYVGLSVRRHLRHMVPGLVFLILIATGMELGLLVTLPERLAMAAVFLISYFGYHHVVKSEGYAYVLSNLKTTKSKRWA